MEMVCSIVIILGVIILVIGVFTGDLPLEVKDHLVMALIGTIAATIIYVGSVSGTTTITEHKDVLEYNNIVYSTPKTIIETEYRGPWWSVAKYKTGKVKD